MAKLYDITRDYYAILELHSTATQDDIKKQYRKLAKVYHPDRNVGAPHLKEYEAKFKLVESAYAVLCDETQRRQYDRSRGKYSPRPATTTTASRPAASTTAAAAGHKPTTTPFANRRTSESPYATRSQSYQHHGYPSAWRATHGAAYGYGRPERRDEVPRTPKKTKDKPYADVFMDESPDLSSTSSRRTTPRGASATNTGTTAAGGGGHGLGLGSGFFANRNPIEKEWMGNGVDPSGYKNSPKRATSDAYYESSQSHARSNRPTPTASSSYSFTPRERTKMNHDAGEDFSRSKDEAAAAGAAPAREGRTTRSRTSTDGPTSPQSPSSSWGRRKSSTGGFGSELNSNDRSRFSYLFNDDNARRSSPRSRRQPSVEEGSDNDDDEDDEFFKGPFKNVFVNMGQKPSPKHKPNGSGKSAASEVPNPQTTSWRENKSRSISPNSSSSVNSPPLPTPRSNKSRKTEAHLHNGMPKASKAKGKGKMKMKAEPFKFKFGATDPEEQSGDGPHANTTNESFTMPTFGGMNFDFTSNVPPPQETTIGQDSTSKASQAPSFNSENWRYAFGSEPQNIFEPSQQSPRKMPGISRLNKDFNAQKSPPNFSRPRPVSFQSTQDLDTEPLSSQTGNETPHSTGSTAQSSTIKFQASNWQKSFTDSNPFMMNQSAFTSGSNNSRPTSRNRKGNIRKGNGPYPKSAFTNSDSEKFKSAFAGIPPFFSNSGTGTSTPSMFGNVSGISNAPSPMAMDLDTPGAASPMPSAEPSPAPGNNNQSNGVTMPDNIFGDKNPFEPDRTARQSRSKPRVGSPKKISRPVSPIKSTETAAPPPQPHRPQTPVCAPGPFVSNDDNISSPIAPPPEFSSPQNMNNDFSFGDMKAVPPFAPTQNEQGIDGKWTEFTDNLPFQSQAAPQVNLSPPASPKEQPRPMPPMPIFPGAPSELTSEVYKRYTNQMLAYQVSWNTYFGDIVQHFKSRLDTDVMNCSRNMGFASGGVLQGEDGTLVDLKRAEKVLREIEDDQKIRSAWEFACQKHALVMREWRDYLEKYSELGA